MDPLSALVNQSPWLSGGFLILWLATLAWVVTGFTNRGWTTRKQRLEINEGRDLLAVEQAKTIVTQGTYIDKLLATNATQAGTISGIDQFFGKLPVKTPQSGDAPRDEPQAVT